MPRGIANVPKGAESLCLDGIFAMFLGAQTVLVADAKRIL
jgi:hypothetical protein